MDDEVATLSATGEILKFLGYDFVVASDGEDAIEIFKKAMNAGAPFDATILDITIQEGLGAQETIPTLVALDRAVKGLISLVYSTDPMIVDYNHSGMPLRSSSRIGLRNSMKRSIAHSNIFFHNDRCCRQVLVVPHWVATITFISSYKSPSPSRALAVTRSVVLLVSLKCARITCGTSFPSAVKQEAAFRFDRCPCFERILRFRNSG